MDSDLKREGGSCTYVMHSVHGLLIKVLTTSKVNADSSLVQESRYLKVSDLLKVCGTRISSGPPTMWSLCSDDSSCPGSKDCNCGIAPFVPGVAGQMQRAHVPSSSRLMSQNRRRRSAAFLTKVRKVEAAVRARESSDGAPRSSDGAHRLARVTTELELGTIASASYSQGQQESAPFGSLISVLNEGVTV